MNTKISQLLISYSDDFLTQALGFSMIKNPRKETYMNKVMQHPNNKGIEIYISHRNGNRLQFKDRDTETMYIIAKRVKKFMQDNTITSPFASEEMKDTMLLELKKYDDTNKLEKIKRMNNQHAQAVKYLKDILNKISTDEDKIDILIEMFEERHEYTIKSLMICFATSLYLVDKEIECEVFNAEINKFCKKFGLKLLSDEELRNLYIKVVIK